MEASEKVSNEATLRDSIREVDAARERVFSDGLSDEELTEACDEYAAAVTAHDKAVGKFGKSK